MLKQLSYIFNKKEKGIIFILFVAAFIGSMMECVGVGVFMPFINILMDTSKIHTTDYLDFFYKHLNFKSDQTFLTAMAAAIIAVFVIKNVYMIVQKYVIYRFSYNTQKKISTRLLVSYMNEPYTFHLNKNIAVLQRSMQEDSDLFARAIIHFMELMIEVMVCLALGIYLFYISHSITVIVVGLLIICVGLFTHISRKYAKGYGKACQGYKAKIYQCMNEALGGIKEVKILNREDYFIASYESYFAKYAKGQRINRLLGVMPKYVVEMVSIAGMLLAVMLKMNYGQKDFTEFIPQLSGFAVAAFRLLPAVGRINEHFTDIMYSSASIELIYNDLKSIEDMKKTNDNYTQNVVNTENSNENENWKLSKNIEIKKICYTYPNTDDPVLENASLTIDKGHTVAFIGESGAGKSTLADIILGLLEPQYGKIKADGMDIYENLNAWHKEIGYIPQMIFLSDDSIKKNIAFGIPDAVIDENAVNDALIKAQLMDFIDGLPGGIDTVIGDRGVRLSGGQRQRIGIARALYRDPQVLILDEATSALDNDTEAAVMQAIDKLHGQKTIIIIAHRLSTIQNADEIYAVEGKQLIHKEKSEVLKLKSEKSDEKE